MRRGKERAQITTHPLKIFLSACLRSLGMNQFMTKEDMAGARLYRRKRAK